MLIRVNSGLKEILAKSAAVGVKDNPKKLVEATPVSIALNISDSSAKESCRIPTDKDASVLPVEKRVVLKILAL